MKINKDVFSLLKSMAYINLYAVIDNKELNYTSSRSGFSFVSNILGTGISSYHGHLLFYNDMRISNANNYKIKLCSFNLSKGTLDVLRTVNMRDLFPMHNVITVTSGDCIKAFTPLLKNSRDYNDWLHFLDNFSQMLKDANISYWDAYFDMMKGLSSFVYYNR